MKIEHIAVWTKDIERLKNFYIKYFNASCGDKYTNNKEKFESYFLSFDKGARFEIMTIPNLGDIKEERLNTVGLSHFAVSVGSKEVVDNLTDRLDKDGYKVKSEPRTTGDGYYESVVLDPDGNRVEITI